jgi:hypothetical protein
MNRIKAVLAAMLTVVGMGLGIGTAAAADPLAYAVEPTCSCGQDAVDSGLCVDHINPPDEVDLCTEGCGTRHWVGGPCPR